MHATCLTIIHDPGMRPGQESNRGPLDLADEYSTTELTLLPLSFFIVFISMYVFIN